MGNAEGIRQVPGDPLQATQPLPADLTEVPPFLPHIPMAFPQRWSAIGPFIGDFGVQYDPPSRRCDALPQYLLDLKLCFKRIEWVDTLFIQPFQAKQFIRRLLLSG